MPLIQYGEYRPDVSDYEGATTKNILNVLPQGDGYGPFPDFTSYTSGLPDICRGAFYALKSDGTVATFAGTSDRLYVMDNTTFSWVDASKGGNAYGPLSPTAQWRFVQFNSLVFATQTSDILQVFDLRSSTQFEDAAGDPPRAAYIEVVGRFLVLSGLLETPYRIQWSGLNNVDTADSWTAGLNSSDFQDLPDGGIVRGVAGGEYGTIFQDQAIRRMIYAPGSPVIFQIERVTQDQGLYAPYSVIRSGDAIFFYSAKGFYKIEPGGLPQQIGRERVDRSFFANLDKGNLQLFIGAADPRGTRVFWAYKSVNGATGSYDTILGYDRALDRFFSIRMRGQYLLGISQTGLTLEALDDLSASIDAMSASLDSYATSVTPEISQFNSENVLGFFRGANLEATLETSEQGTDGRRIFIRGFRPVTDAAEIYGMASFRDNQQAGVTITPEAQINPRTGRCDFRKETRYSRFRTRIPAGAAWSFNVGVEPDITTAGAL
jgi:hypothetical protein